MPCPRTSSTEEVPVAEPDRRNRAEHTAGTSYRDVLRLDRLLACQPESGAHDELLFIIVHQVHELWFKLMLFELQEARDLLLADRLDAAEHLLRRLVAVQNVLVSQWAVLDTMLPMDFLAFRNTLQGGSGFDSAQYREIEFLAGLKDSAYLDRARLTDTERERLTRRLAEPSLREAFIAVAERSGVDPLAKLWQDGYQDLSPERWELVRVAEALLDVDQAFGRWRTHHALSVERQIGYKAGTGGSSGVDYLFTRIAARLFPELWEIRSQL
ncbi:tryptophan 2,3-dioxygenase family protein [Amycolatopsis sp. OK19-0408]|uniref:Tryptophan 2,3-dioxygenase family protein n=1 Tax=Amycolatopsis iheyensis TaxID=2945988 RepID=A0A9X2NIG7_9PSEU|nr:tryptophan 2,3-dioxygenase family protein [Amycolatopsis iheyensis]MCR6488458.1 tryptophan 2,3-dioxygenase family protein [Amycolatopsis iheyensis]